MASNGYTYCKSCSREVRVRCRLSGRYTKESFIYSKMPYKAIRLRDRLHAIHRKQNAIKRNIDKQL